MKQYGAVYQARDHNPAPAGKRAQDPARRPPVAKPSGGWDQLAARVPVSRHHDSDEREAERNAGMIANFNSAPMGAEMDRGGAEGQPLPGPLGRHLEQRLGHNFSDVRVHADASAGESARALDARAYTYGSHVVFGKGQFDPSSGSGLRLLGHELTHVLQQRAGLALQRQPINDKPPNIDAIAAEVEDLVRPKNDEKGALEKLNVLDMRDLLAVTEKLYFDADANAPNEGKRRAFGLLNGDLGTAPNDATKGVNVQRLTAAFDAAPARRLRNPSKGDPGTSPTISGYRNKSKVPGAARPGDWGEDPGGNTWVAHVEGIRTYFGSEVDAQRRTSTWLGNNVSNFDYVKSLTKRAIGSFHWGKGVHDFAIYLSLPDCSADLRERVRPFDTIENYIHAHLAPTDDFDTYVKNMQKVVAVKIEDPTSVWTKDDGKWNQLVKGFMSAEGWVVGTTITRANVDSISSDPKDAPQVAYYRALAGGASTANAP